MKTTEIVLSIIAIILLITTAGFAYMYYSEVGIASSNANTAQQYKSQASSLQSQLQVAMPAIALSTAMSHWNNIAIENPSSITAQYSPNAELKWIGGPLTGTYTGTQQISSVWTKFSNLYEYVVWYAEVPPTVTVSGTHASVFGQLQFVVFPFNTTTNPAPKAVVLNVNETLTYTFNTSTGTWYLSQELWQVKPAPISSVAPGYISEYQ
ncbi:MAG: hypothetical protein ACP5NC_08135 [Nitrososphaeria archaeon]